jgi:hypothetical protein
MSEKPTDAEVQAEIERLEAIKSRLRSHNECGDDNVAAIDAQLEVLKEGFDEITVFSRYGSDEEHHTLDKAHEAQQWMEYGGPLPSRYWRSEIILSDDDWKALGY